MSISRRHFLTTTLAAALVSCKKPESEPQKPNKPDLSQGGVWSGLGFGTEISAEIWGVNQAQGNAFMKQIEQTISALEESFSLYLEQSELRILNRERTLKKPSQTFLDILRKAKSLSKSTLGYTQPAIHHIWLRVQEKLDQAENPKDINWSEIPHLTEHWEAASMDHLIITEDEIQLTHPLTQISLNSIGQGYATDIVAKMLRDAGVTSAKIDCGETYCIGKHPEDRPWNLGVAGNGDLLGFIELQDAGLAVSSSAPDKILLDPIKCRIVPSLTTAAITTSAGACTADAFATAFAIAPKKQHPRLRQALESLGKSQVHVW